MGAKLDPRREAYRLRYGLTRKQVHHLTQEKMDQLDRCLSDGLRMIILGINQSREDTL